jgi:hypothetical protein
MWFAGINYYKLAAERDRDSIVKTIWKPVLTQLIYNMSRGDVIKNFNNFNHSTVPVEIFQAKFYGGFVSKKTPYIAKLVNIKILLQFHSIE